MKFILIFLLLFDPEKKHGCQEEVTLTGKFKYKAFTPEDIRFEEFDFHWNGKLVYSWGVRMEGLKLIVWAEIARPTFWLPHSLVDATPDWCCWGTWAIDMPPAPTPPTPFRNTWEVIDMSYKGERAIIYPSHAHLTYLYPWKIAIELRNLMKEYLTALLDEVWCQIAASIPGIGPFLGLLTGFRIKISLKSFDGNDIHPFYPSVIAYFSDYDLLWRAKDVEIPGIGRADWSYLQEPQCLLVYKFFPEVMRQIMGTPYTLEQSECLFNFVDESFRNQLSPYLDMKIPGTNVSIGEAFKYSYGCWGPVFPYNGIATFGDYYQSAFTIIMRAVYRFYDYAKPPQGWRIIEERMLKLQPWAPKKTKGFLCGYPLFPSPNLWDNPSNKKQTGVVVWQKFKAKVKIEFFVGDEGACGGASPIEELPLDDNWLKLKDIFDLSWLPDPHELLPGGGW